MTAFRDLPNAEYEGLRPVLSRPPVGAYMRDLWSRREFIFAVPRNSLRAQNMDTLLGNFWYLLNLALQTSVYCSAYSSTPTGVSTTTSPTSLSACSRSVSSRHHHAVRCVVNNRFPSDRCTSRAR